MNWAEMNCDIRGPRDYVPLPPNAIGKFLDVGPGRYPHPRADKYLDHDAAVLDAAEIPAERRILGDLESGLPKIRDKAWDYIWCSHVLEHVNDPQACARTLSRIGKSGTIVVPSAIKEAIFNFEEPEHRWLVLPHPTDGEPPVFVRHNAQAIARIKNRQIQGLNCALYRNGTRRQDADDEFMREWFFDTEPALDVVFHWVDRLALTVIG